MLISAENQHSDRDDGISLQHIHTYFLPLFYHFLHRTTLFVLPLHTYPQWDIVVSNTVHLYLSLWLQDQGKDALRCIITVRYSGS